MYSMLMMSASINEYGDDDYATPAYINDDVDETDKDKKVDWFSQKTVKLSGTELDLHGCSHTEVTDTLENILILQYNTGNWPLTVVTGNSQKMKSIVIKHASRRGFNTRLPIDNNPGSLIVF